MYIYIYIYIYIFFFKRSERKDHEIKKRDGKWYINGHIG